MLKIISKIFDEKYLAIMYLDLKIRIKFMLISMKYSNKSKMKNIMLNDLAFNLKKSTNCQLLNVTNLNKFI